MKFKKKIIGSKKKIESMLQKRKIREGTKKDEKSRFTSNLCPTCGFTSEDLSLHKCEISTKQYKCEACSYITYSEEQFQKHMKDGHELMFKCQTCSYSANRKANLNMH